MTVRAMLLRPRGIIVYSLSNMAGAYSDSEFGANTYVVQVRFNTDGTVDVLKNIGADLFDEEQHTDPGFASSGTSVRCTHVSGNDMTSGDARGVWHAITVGRNFIMSYVAGPGPDDISGRFDFELSDDGGSTIVATKSNVNITVGSL